MIAHRKSLLKRSPFWYCYSSFQLLLSRNHSDCLYMHLPFRIGNIKAESNNSPYCSPLPSVFCIYTQRSPPLAYSATGYLLSLALYPCCPLMALSASACHGFCGCALCYRSRLVVLSCSPFGPFGPFVRTWVQFIRCRSHTGAVLPSLWLPCLPISLSHG